MSSHKTTVNFMRYSMTKVTQKKAKSIAKKAKARAYDTNLEASTLFQILSNIGGEFGLIIRHKIEEYGDIDQVSVEESFSYIDWLPHDMYHWLIKQANNGLVKASFVTNSKSEWHQHWHIVADSAKKVVIETKVRNWAKTEVGKSFIKNNGHRNDGVTTFHWI